ncbi:E3 ubiquitin-protein ligase MARCH5-like [Drosophila pseudoobscura]|uniref:E3 ubiquitin-protein ligase MARCHF5 n=1 Tax=Drosophila pseudoobscura pseudoobscura TaxID=46245 RepID=A0A6I8V242_DROPS|nr:E3 ubiquitin-protein ligase MARCH5 [Drosophila pseudoobscura]
MLRLRQMRRSQRQRVYGGLEEERMCWICLESDEEPPQRSDWLHPCRCRGSNKWVHRSCLNRWIDETQLLHPNRPIACSQCLTEYLIVDTPLCRFDALLLRIEDVYGILCPSVAVGTLSATLYFSAMTFGALTVIQVIGCRKSLALLNEETTLLMIALPMIPAGLLLLRNLKLDEYLLRLVRIFRRRRVSPENLDEGGELLPGAPLDDSYFDDLPLDRPALGLDFQDPDLAVFDHETLRRPSASFIVALSLPTVSVFLGNTLYAKVDDRLLGIFLGAITFLGIKGMASAYIRHSHEQRMRGRYVMDYNSERH